MIQPPMAERVVYSVPFFPVVCSFWEIIVKKLGGLLLKSHLSASLFLCILCLFFCQGCIEWESPYAVISTFLHI
jgi:hypothetical protein